MDLPKQIGVVMHDAGDWLHLEPGIRDSLGAYLAGAAVGMGKSAWLARFLRRNLRKGTTVTVIDPKQPGTADAPPTQSRPAPTARSVSWGIHAARCTATGRPQADRLPRWHDTARPAAHQSDLGRCGLWPARRKRGKGCGSCQPC